MTGLGVDNARWVRPLGDAADGDWPVSITPGDGWSHTTLRVANLLAGQSISHDLGEEEAIVVPLSGAVDVLVGDEAFALAGRDSVFAGPADVVYAGRGARVTLTATDGPARVALAGGPATKRAEALPARLVRAVDVPVELRGAGTSSREVRAFGLPNALEADSILVCEVLTPAGNWSSWPPHKHDEDRPGEETELEEIYYFETRATSDATTDPVAFHRISGTDDRPIDVLAEVRTGDVVLVPHGWHGPSIAAPDADLYYLNVMAGPGRERAWRICDDPAHAAVRDTWTDLPVDARLPFGGATS